MKKTIAHILIVSVIMHPITFAYANVPVMQNRTVIAAQSAPIPAEHAECFEIYAGCMDGFCTGNNVNAGRCQCSNDFANFDEQWQSLEQQVIQINRQAEQTIDIISEAPAARDTRAARLEQLRAGTNINLNNASPAQQSAQIQNLTGAALFTDSHRLCAARMPAHCNMQMIQALYQQSIRSDCRAYELAIGARTREIAQMQRDAAAEIRAAALDTFDSANRLNQSQCITEVMACMRTDNVCGRNWSRCFGNRLQSQFRLCEHILNECDIVRDNVRDAFMNIAGPMVAAAERNASAESDQMCLRDLSDCMRNACAADMGDRGTFNACLANTRAIETFCAPEMERCNQIPGILNLAIRRAESLRVDACREEVRECFAHDMRCGPNFERCIGLDADALSRMCPPERLVVCSRANPNFSLHDVIDYITGIFLTLDNNAMDACIAAADGAMIEICGDAYSCDRFVNLENFGMDSLARERLAGIDSVTGMISFGAIEVNGGAEWSECMITGGQNCNQFPLPGTLMIAEYMVHFDNVNPNAGGARGRVESQLLTIQRDIDVIMREFDNNQIIQRCIGGRDLRQIGLDRTTDGLFPLITNPHRMAIARAALNTAALNHSERIAETKIAISRESEIMQAQFQCYSIPHQVDSAVRAASRTVERITGQPLVRAPSQFETVIGVERPNLSNADIMALSGRSVSTTVGDDNLSVRMDMVATFSPDTRICRICTEMTICGSETDRERIREMIRQENMNTAMLGAAGVLLAVGLAVLTIPVVGWIVGAVVLVVAGLLFLATTFASSMAEDYACEVDPPICREERL